LHRTPACGIICVPFFRHPNPLDWHPSFIRFPSRPLNRATSPAKSVDGIIRPPCQNCSTPERPNQGERAQRTPIPS
ncbi:MAG: hypothetical protein ACPGWR_28300, partial [Ardenticatenaceae bacterium]